MVGTENRERERDMKQAIPGRKTTKRLWRHMVRSAVSLAGRMEDLFWGVVDGRRPSPLPGMTARAACCLDAASGAVLLARQAELRVRPASLAKLMTALLLVRSTKLDETVEIASADITRGSVVGLRAGDILRYRDLLHALLLASGNDAATAIARTLAARGHGSDPVASFVRAMNEHAHTLGLTKTRFRNPSGLDALGQYSCARDLAVLAREAFRNPEIRAAISTPMHRIEYRGPHARRQEIVSTHALLGHADVVGGKTGTTRRARGCLALLARLDDREVVAVVMGSALQWDPSGQPIPNTDRRYADVRELLSILRESGH